MESSDSKDLRPDGRFPDELREMKFEFGCVENKGFVLFSQGSTLVRTTISKTESKKQLNINLNFSQTSRNDPLGERKQYEMKQKLISIFGALIPNENQIEANVEILQDNGSLFSVIVNSISLAFCYCGINTTEMCVSLTLNNCVDLCYVEENRSFGAISVVDPAKDEILYFESFGPLQKGELLKCLEASKMHCNAIYQRFRSELISIVP